MAPELMHGVQYNYKADIWSMGTSLFETLTGCTPFGGSNRRELVENVNRGIIRIPRAFKLSYTCLDFLSKCLRFKQKDRISVENALNHPFLKDDGPRFME